MCAFKGGSRSSHAFILTDSNQQDPAEGAASFKDPMKLIWQQI